MEEQRQRWAEHFRELLNSPAPDTMSEIRPTEHHLAPDCSISSINEIIKAIKMLKNGKSPGPDLIPAEALKADPQITARILLPLLTKIWETDELPQDWKKGYIIKLPKRGFEPVQKLSRHYVTLCNRKDPKQNNPRSN